MPIIRRQFIAEVEQSMPLKRSMTVLICRDAITKRDWVHLEQLDRLRIHLADHLGQCCKIRLLVWEGHVDLITVFNWLDLEVEIVRSPDPGPLAFDTGDAALQQAIAIALEHDCDYILVPVELLAHIEDVEEQYHVLLTDATFLLKCAELFVRGMDVAWAFTNPVLYQSFSTLYLLSEAATFKPGFDLCGLMHEKHANVELIDTTKALVNRLSNICFTRDRLLFYCFQREAALRNKVRRQEFKLETSYHLNFYYLLLYGAFDHAALIVNGVLGLGLKDREVGATYAKFRDALRVKHLKLHHTFTSASTQELVDRFGALRHYSAHRGSIAPALIVDMPTRELSNEELDGEIKKSGGFEWLYELPEGLQKEQLLHLFRTNKRGELLEQNVVARDVVFVEMGGKRVGIQPLNDVTWNFDRIVSFLNDVLTECGRLLR